MRGRTLALFGLGGSGLVTARALREGGAKVVVWDDNPDSVNRARDEGLNASDLRDADWSAFAALILAPGVPLTHPKPHWTVEKARGANVKVIGDIELFCRERAAVCPEAPVVAVTGTNGKSTTTALIAHLLRAAGCDVQMGGNIGVPILELKPPSLDRIHVIECSSYQIDLAPSLNPSVGVLLNITPDHLDRHGSFERYAAIKERLVAGAATAVIVIDDEPCRAIRERMPEGNDVRAATVSGYDWQGGKRADAPAGVIDDDRLSILHRPAGMHGATEVAMRDWGRAGERAPLTLRGPHNEANTLAALLACDALGADIHAVLKALDTFPGLPHRMEPVEHEGPITFINDSKATNADATAPALGSFARLRWIAGGLPKDGGITTLRPHFDRIEKAYLIGEAAPDFAATLGDTVPYEISSTLDVAVAHAAQDAREAGGGVVLFSPAAASFDQFRNFEERGKAFKAAVRDLES